MEMSSQLGSMLFAYESATASVIVQFENMMMSACRCLMGRRTGYTITDVKLLFVIYLYVDNFFLVMCFYNRNDLKNRMLVHFHLRHKVSFNLA